ncbi:hypothetical protein F4778DRAFT_414343 [Xylariomycetidae sp. FL2044]|nr:hypothetical protein F4778DRAFT_414343 [Xylariomycetidae sp. FL2044]
MQFTLACTTLLAAISTVSANGCYSGGEDGDKGAGLTEHHWDVVCGYLKGDYLSQESRETCVTDNKGIKWAFELKCISDNYRSIDVAECKDGMKKSAMNCEYGGDIEYTNWEYTADPNAGRCISS